MNNLLKDHTWIRPKADALFLALEPVLFLLTGWSFRQSRGGSG